MKELSDKREARAEYKKGEAQEKAHNYSKAREHYGNAATKSPTNNQYNEAFKRCDKIVMDGE